MKDEKYVVTFEFVNANGKWTPDRLTNNDEGFSFEDAQRVQYMVKYSIVQTRNVEVVEMQKERI